MTSKYQVSKTTAKRSLERAKEQGWADKLREVAEDRGPATADSTGNSGERMGETDADVDADGEPDDGMGDQVVATTEQVSPPQSRRQPQQQQSPPQQQPPQQQIPQQARQQTHTNPHQTAHQHHAHTPQPQNPSHPFHQSPQHANLHPQQPRHAPEEGLLEQNLRTQAMGYLQYQQLSDSHMGSPEMSMSLQGGNMSYGSHRRA